MASIAICSTPMRTPAKPFAGVASSATGRCCSAWAPWRSRSDGTFCSKVWPCLRRPSRRSSCAARGRSTPPCGDRPRGLRSTCVSWVNSIRRSCSETPVSWHRPRTPWYSRGSCASCWATHRAGRPWRSPRGSAPSSATPWTGWSATTRRYSKRSSLFRCISFAVGRRGPILIVDRIDVRRGLPATRAEAGPAGPAHRERDRRLRHVVVVVALEEVVAQALRIHRPVVGPIELGAREGRVDMNADYVIARRHRGLPIATVKHEVLSAEPLVVLVGATGADALVAHDRRAEGTGGPPADMVDPGSGRLNPAIPRHHVDHAEAALRRLPHLAGGWIHELVGRVMLEMPVLVTGGELVQPVARCHVHRRVAQRDVGVADVGRIDREAHDPVRYGGIEHAAFLERARSLLENLIVHDP